MNPSAAPPDTPPATDPSTSPIGQARQAFASGDYPTATQLTQQALGQMPNDVSLHEFLALCLFAQGNYEQAAAPLYAVLSVGPGWDWTTLIGNYPDASTYTGQLRGLEAFVKANPRSAQGLFVLAYHYISEGHPEVAIQPLKNVLALPAERSGLGAAPRQASATDRRSGHDPAGRSRPARGRLGRAGPSERDDHPHHERQRAASPGAFATPGKPPVTIAGTYTLADNVLTLSGKDTPGGPLAGQVAAPDERHLSFKAVGGPGERSGPPVRPLSWSVDDRRETRQPSSSRKDNLPRSVRHRPWMRADRLPRSGRTRRRMGYRRRKQFRLADLDSFPWLFDAVS